MKGLWGILAIVAAGLVAGSLFYLFSRPHPEEEGAPRLADWDGEHFLNRDDARAMGADMSSPEPIAYRREGPAHLFQLGLGELEVKVWAYARDEGAAQRFEIEKKEDAASCAILLKSSKAGVAEVSGTGPAYIKKIIRTDGWGIVTNVARRGGFVVKVMRAEKASEARELDGIGERSRKALDVVAAKLSTSGR